MSRLFAAIVAVGIAGCGSGGGSAGGGQGGGSTGGGGGATGGGGGTGGGSTGGGTGGTGGGSTGGGTGGSTGGGAGGGTGGGSPIAGDGGLYDGDAYSFFGNWNDVAVSAAGQFLAVGDHGLTARSTDGRGWSMTFAPTDQHLLGVTYFAAQSRWVASGSDGGIFTSPDGVVWDGRETGTGPLYDVAASATRVVAVGFNRHVSSADGLAWAPGTGLSGNNKHFVSVAYGTQGFHALAPDWNVRSSADGLAFTGNTASPCPGQGGQADEIVFTDGRYFVGGFEMVCNFGGIGAGAIPAKDIYPGKGFFRGLASDTTTFVAMGSGIDWAVGDAGSLTAQEAFHDTNVNALAHHGGNWVAVGTAGLLLHSSDGRTWTEINPSAITRDYARLAHGNGRTVASGSNSLIRVLVSTDGGAWVPARPWFNVDFANGEFFGHSLDGRYATSTDGLTWSAPRQMGVVANFQRVAYGNGVYVAGGADVQQTPLRPVLMYSYDAGQWFRADAGIPNGSIEQLTFGNGVFVASGYRPEATTMLRSTDGVTWQPVFIDAGTSVNVQSIAYGNGRFVFSHGASATTRSSTDGLDWATHPQSSDFTSGTRPYFGNGEFVVTAANKVFTSADGAAWSQLDGGVAAEMPNLGLFAAGLHVFGKDQTIAISSDLRTFDLRAYEPGRAVTAMDFAGGRLRYTTAGGTEVTKSGVNPLVSTPIGGRAGYARFIRKGTTVVALTDRGTVRTSTDDGVSFQNVALPAPATGEGQFAATGIVHNGSFLITGPTQYLYSSPDGLTWTRQGLGNGDVLFSGGGKVVVCRASTGMKYSTNDGALFTNSTTLSYNENCRAGVYGGGRYVIVNDDGEILGSPDAITWTVVRPSSNPNGTMGANFTSVVFDNGRFVAAGEAGLMATSADGLAWTAVRAPSFDVLGLIAGPTAGEYFFHGSKGITGKLRFR